MTTLFIIVGAVLGIATGIIWVIRHRYRWVRHTEHAMRAEMWSLEEPRYYQRPRYYRQRRSTSSVVILIVAAIATFTAVFVLSSLPNVNWSQVLSKLVPVLSGIVSYIGSVFASAFAAFLSKVMYDRWKAARRWKAAQERQEYLRRRRRHLNRRP